MIGLGTVINISTIILGSILGLTFKQKIKDNYKRIIIQGIGLTTLVVGLVGATKGFITSKNNYIFVIVILSIVLGVIIGTYLELNEKINALGLYLERKFSKQNSNFAQGFITSSLIYCVGAMAIIGSVNDGISGDYSILLIKAILDGVTSMVLASTLGFGVLFSFVPVLLYQGSITLLAYFFEQFISLETQNQMTVVGNILIISIGLDLLEIKKIKTIDMLPALLILVIYNLIKLLF